MVDTPPAERPPLGRRWQRGIGLGALAFAAVVFAYLIGWGTSGNTLHESAMWWCGFLGTSVVLAWALGLDERLPTTWWTHK